jgi:oligopeptide transport system ATP-binding protein
MAAVADRVLLDVVGLSKTFRGDGRRASLPVRAVDDLSFTLARGGSLVIVGESGSGKTTTARMLAGLERPDAGQIFVNGRPRIVGERLRGHERRHRGREIQIVFQDPYSSLDPRQRVQDALDEVLRFHFDLTKPRRIERVASLLEQVGLGPREARALPRELSGGQRQRVAIARALAAEPSVLILDEAVSALDVSIQAQILNLLQRIRSETGVAYVVVSHDLGVVRRVTDDALVMLRGTVVELGPTDRLLRHPEHRYTKMLLDSIPRIGWEPGKIAARRRTAAAES